MGIFKSKPHFIWEIIDSKTSYQKSIDASFNDIIVIFKHSTRCSISNMVKSRIESVNSTNNDPKCYYLDLLNYREISNDIANDLYVKHESPQVLIIENGKCIKHISHNKIDWNEILS